MKINVGFVLNNNKDSWRGGYEYKKTSLKLFKMIKNQKLIQLFCVVQIKIKILFWSRAKYKNN